MVGILGVSFVGLMSMSLTCIFPLAVSDNQCLQFLRFLQFSDDKQQLLAVMPPPWTLRVKLSLLKQRSPFLHHHHPFCSVFLRYFNFTFQNIAEINECVCLLFLASSPEMSTLSHCIHSPSQQATHHLLRQPVHIFCELFFGVILSIFASVEQLIPILHHTIVLSMVSPVVT